VSERATRRVRTASAPTRLTKRHGRVFPHGRKRSSVFSDEPMSCSSHSCAGPDGYVAHTNSSRSGTKLAAAEGLGWGDGGPPPLFLLPDLTRRLSEDSTARAPLTQRGSRALRSVEERSLWATRNSESNEARLCVEEPRSSVWISPKAIRTAGP
jgi:hypothetical protein